MVKLTGFKDMLSVATTEQIIGVVLAGGQSSRMGESKALMPIGQQTWLQHAIDKLKASSCNKIIISGQLSGYETIEDNWQGLGPVAGIVSVLKAIPIQATFIFIPVDMLALDSQMLENLLQQSKNFDGCHYPSSSLPLCLHNNLHTQQKVNELAEQLTTLQPQAKAPSLKNLMQGLTIYQCECNEKQLLKLKNINTPDEWHAFQKEQA